MEKCGPASANESLLSSIADQGLLLEDLSEFLSPNAMIESTVDWREMGLSETLVAFAVQGSGDLFCFETSDATQTAPEDAIVWYFDHEEGESSSLEMTFTDWIRQYAELKNSEA